MELPAAFPIRPADASFVSEFFSGREAGSPEIQVQVSSDVHFAGAGSRRRRNRICDEKRYDQTSSSTSFRSPLSSAKSDLERRFFGGLGPPRKS
jgi:hypothetical protein